MDWSVRVTVSPLRDTAFSDAEAARIAGALARHGGAVSFTERLLDAQFTVEAPTVRAAVLAGLGVWRQAVARARVTIARVERAEAVTHDQLTRELAEPLLPELVGVAETAEILGVSKQRVGELAAEGRLPRPVADLRSGTIWTRPSVEAFLARWERRPGRPRARAWDVDLDVSPAAGELYRALERALPRVRAAGWPFRRRPGEELLSVRIPIEATSRDRAMERALVLWRRLLRELELPRRATPTASRVTAAGGDAA